MKPLVTVAIAVLNCTFLAVGITGCEPRVKKTDVGTFDEMDNFQNELAGRAAKQIGSSSDFKIVVTQAAMPIGTILRKGTTIPVDYNSCVPNPKPPSAPILSLFPTYALSRSLAVDFGLDNTLISEIGQLGIKVSDVDSVAFSVSTPHIQTLSDHDLAALTSAGKCGASIPSDSAVWLVRGYITGRRSFVLSNTVANGVMAKVTKVGTFSVYPGSGSASLKVADDADTAFLEIVSEVLKPSTNGPARIASPKADSSTGQVFIQRDRADTSGNAERVIQQLSARSFSVAGAAERIESSKMPLGAQVRYFNASDRAYAEEALQVLKQQYPDAALKLIGLPAPKAQLEVWLPRYTGT